MKKNTSLLIFAFVTSLLAASTAGPKVASNSYPPGPDLVLTVTAIKAIYKTTEPIDLDFNLENKGAGQQVVPRHLKLRTNISLQIVDQHGQSAKWCGRISDELVFLKSNYKTISPGQSIRATLTISCNDAGDPGRAWGYNVSTPGGYAIQTKYQLTLPKENLEKAFPGANVVVGPIVAAPVKIELR